MKIFHAFCIGWLYNITTVQRRLRSVLHKKTTRADRPKCYLLDNNAGGRATRLEFINFQIHVAYINEFLVDG